MIQCKESKEKLIEYLSEKESYFRNVDEETYQAIREFLNFIFSASCNGAHSKRLKRRVFHFFGLFSFSLFCYSIKGYYADTM